MRMDPAEFQAWIDAQVLWLDVPCLAVSGGRRPRVIASASPAWRMSGSRRSATAISSIWSMPQVSPHGAQFVEHWTVSDDLTSDGPGVAKRVPLPRNRQRGGGLSDP